MTKAKKEEDDLVGDTAPAIGHNSFSKIELTKVIDVIEKLNTEAEIIKQDIRAAVEVAAQHGIDKRTLREMIKLRALDDGVRQEREELRDMYLHALGLL